MTSLQPTVTKRLAECVTRAGGKRAIAAKSGISEAQLYRYLTGESVLPINRLQAIAKAAAVDTSWLLTGQGAPEGPQAQDPRPSFRPELMVQVIETFNELLLEYEKPFTPKQRAQATTLIYESLRHTEIKRNSPLNLQKTNMLEVISFLGDLRTEDELRMFQRVLELSQYNKENIVCEDNLQLLNTFCNLITRGYASYYNSHIGQLYFDRMGTQIDNNAAQRLINMLEEFININKKQKVDFLDIGCGNGRHISYIYRHFPNVNVKGLELSLRGVELGNNLIQSGKLPAGSITHGDYRRLPYNDLSFDLLFSRMSLWSIPYFPGSDLGMEEVFQEAYRVLRPGGMFVITSLYGEGQEFLPFRQYLNERDIENLCKTAGFKLLKTEHLNSVSDNGGKSGIDYSSILDKSFRTVLQK